MVLLAGGMLSTILSFTTMVPVDREVNSLGKRGLGEAEDGSGERYTICQMNQMEEHDAVWSGRCQTTKARPIKGVDWFALLPRRLS